MPYRPAQVWTGSAWDDIGDKRVGIQEINTQTANYTLALTDIAKRVQMNNTAARTITIPTNASVAFPVGTRIDIANINTGVLTIAAASGATVNGRALTLGQWETATVVQRAANNWVVEPQAGLTAALGSKADKAAGYQFAETVYFTSSGTFTKATYPWLRAIRVKCQGGGGGSGGVTAPAGNGAISGGGGGGAYADSFITNVGSLDASVTVTVGAGGSAGAAGNNNGGSGGTSSFGTAVTADGGGGGQGSGGQGALQYLPTPGNGATGGTGDLLIPGQTPPPPFLTTGIVAGLPGGSSHLGAGGPGSVATVTKGQGDAGKVYGGGGGSSVTRDNQGTEPGAAGAAGIVIVELFA